MPHQQEGLCNVSLALQGQRFTKRLPPSAVRPGEARQSCAIVSPQAVKIEIVVKVSTWRKMAVVARVAGQQAGRNRTVSAFAKAARATARSFGNVLHQLWLEMVGVLFLVMALSFGSASVKEFGKYQAGQVGAGRVAVTICFAVTFAWFGVSSFWRVRKKKQRS
jgi:hypothetical protein